MVVLDKIRSLYNVGAIIRTSDAFGIGEVILCGYTPTPEDERLWKRQLTDPDAQISKTALKGLQTVTWRQEDSAEIAITKLKAAGYFCVALEQHPTSIALSKRIQKPIANISTMSSQTRNDKVAPGIRELVPSGKIPGLPSRDASWQAEDDRKNFAIVIGNELDGVSPEALVLCDQIMEIPMRGKSKSLNVAVAFGIAAFTILG